MENNNSSLEDDFVKDMTETGRFILSIGIKGSGKSFTMLSFLKLALYTDMYERYHIILPMFKHEQNGSYDFLKSQKHCMIYNGYSQRVSDIVDKDRLKYKTLYIIDDASSELLGNFDDTFLKLITTARHGCGVTMWVCVHSCKRILAPMIRQNVDWLFVYKLSNKKLLDDLFEEFVSLKFEAFKDFRSYYDQIMNEKNNGMLFTIHNDNIDGDVKNWVMNTDRDTYELEPHAPLKKDIKKEENKPKNVGYHSKHNISTKLRLFR